MAEQESRPADVADDLAPTRVRAGQIWRSRDPRDKGRKVRVVAVGMDGRPDRLLVRNTATRRHSQIGLASLPRLYALWMDVPHA